MSGSSVFLHLLEIGRVIAVGEGVVAAAGSGDELVELAGGLPSVSLEHHVLEHVRDAGLAVDFVHAAGAVPDHGHDHRCAAVLLDDDAQAIRERVLVWVGQGRAEQAAAASNSEERRLRMGKRVSDRISGEHRLRSDRHLRGCAALPVRHGFRPGISHDSGS